MDYSKLPAQEYLRQCLSYCPETGRFVWLVRPRWMFPNDRIWNSVNRRWAGRDAFTTCSGHGYFGRLDGVHYHAGRLAFKMMTGRDPEGEIDHINGNPRDNRWSNLRDVPRAENMKNKAQSRKSKRPYVGVQKSGNKWAATIGGRSAVWLGSFDTLEEAIAARKSAEKKLGYHANHGRRPPNG